MDITGSIEFQIIASVVVIAIIRHNVNTETQSKQYTTVELVTEVNELRFSDTIRINCACCDAASRCKELYYFKRILEKHFSIEMI